MKTIFQNQVVLLKCLKKKLVLFIIPFSCLSSIACATESIGKIERTNINAEQSKHYLRILKGKMNLSFVNNLAQDSSKKAYPKANFELGWGLRDKAQMKGYFVITYPNNWGVSFGLANDNLPALDLPSKFTKVNVGQKLPRDKVTIFTIAVAKRIPTRFKRVRFSVEAGPSMVSYQRATFTYVPTHQSYSSIWDIIFGTSITIPGHYEYKYKSFEELGVNLRTKVEFHVSSKVGIELAGCANLNRLQSFIGGEVFLQFGQLMNK